MPSSRLSTAHGYHAHNKNHVTLKYALVFNRLLEVVKAHVHASWVAATQKHTKDPCDLDLWPTNLIFNRLLEGVEVHSRAKFQQAKCSGSWVILFTGKEQQLENNTAIASACSNYVSRIQTLNENQIRTESCTVQRGKHSHSGAITRNWWTMSVMQGLVTETSCQISTNSMPFSPIILWKNSQFTMKCTTSPVTHYNVIFQWVKDVHYAATMEGFVDQCWIIGTVQMWLTDW